MHYEWRVKLCHRTLIISNCIRDEKNKKNLYFVGTKCIGRKNFRQTRNFHYPVNRKSNN